MEGFTYHDLFSTKGIEYLVIIAFLLLLVPFTLLLNRRIRSTRLKAGEEDRLSDIPGILPKGVYFSKNHTWMFLERAGFARVGVDSMFSRMTGPLSIRFVKSPGDTVRKGEVIAETLHGSQSLRILSPLSGTLRTVNTENERLSGLIAADPLGEGWLFTIKPKAWQEETFGYFLASRATEWAKSELARFRDFLARESRLTAEPLTILQDGGEPVGEAMTLMPGDSWARFQDEFLSI